MTTIITVILGCLGYLLLAVPLALVTGRIVSRRGAWRHPATGKRETEWRRAA